MLRTLLKSFLGGIVLLAAITSSLAQSPADATPADKYNVSGSVLSALSKHGHFYQVATDSRIYLLMCTKVRVFQSSEPECKIADKPIATGDALHFRIDGDWAYMPPNSPGEEQKLRILTTELKVIPALPASTPAAPAPTANGKTPTAAPEPGIVIGTGVHVKGQHGLGWSTAPGMAVAPSVTTASAATPVIATGPVMAVPVTGGVPVLVTPTGPTTGGVVTGIPVTGGAPITAIPTAPVMGVPVGGAPAGGGMVMMGGSAPQWVHVLRIQTAGKIYQLECSGKPCALANKQIELGDALALRVDKKHAYLSSNSLNAGAEQEFKILNETDSGSAPDSKQP